MVNNLYQKLKNLNRVDFLIVILFLVSIFSFLFFTGTLTSGYHFIDDHGIINIKLSLESDSFIKASINYIKNDFNIRFRPLYYAYYVSLVKIFGLNFLNTSLFVGVLAVSSFSFFYIGMRKLNHSIPESLIFVLMTFIGPQFAIWWRLGTNETIGMFFLGLSFLFMSKCLNRDSYKKNNAIFIIFLVIASLCKESFIIIIPAFIVFKIWNEKNTFKITVGDSIRNNYLLVIPLIVMLFELLIIKFAIGANKIGYAGTAVSVLEFMKGLENIIFNRESLLPWLVFIVELAGLSLLSFLFLREKVRVAFLQSLISLSVYLCFSFLVVLPNIAMHAKSGMIERYLLPSTLGLSFLVIGIFKNTKQMYFKWAMFLVITVFIFGNFTVAHKNAVRFAFKGVETNRLLSGIVEKSKKDSKILLVVDPVDYYEVSWSLRTYLSYHDFDDLYAYPMTRIYNNDFEKALEKEWMLWFKRSGLSNMSQDPDSIIFLDKKQINQFFNQSNIAKNLYDNVADMGENYALYIKNN